MKKESKEMLEILHKHHEEERTRSRIEKQLKDYRTKKAQEKERKQELSEHRAMTMLIIALMLLYMFIIGLI